MNKKDLDFIKKFSRNEYGLIDSEEYSFNEDGSINWRLMIRPEHLYVNKAWFEQNGKEAPESAVGLKDHQVLITLAGIKELSKLRGVKKVSYDVKTISDKYVSAKCRITWIGNYETNHQEVVFEDAANATSENTDDVYAKFLETIACNRAFVRCVRNFLNIHVVGYDEMDQSDQGKARSMEPSSDSTPNNVTKPSGALQAACEENDIRNLDELKEFLREKWEDKSYRNKSAKDWEKFDDIPAKDCRIITALVKKKE